MNLLLVTDTFPPDINGVARTLHAWVEGLRRCGHRVMVVTTLEPQMEAAQAWGERGQRVAVSVPLPGYPGLRVGMSSRREMAHWIEECRADVLYVATETPLGLAAIRAARDAGVPVVSGFHTNFQSYLENYALPGLEKAARAFLKSVHNRTARTLTPSEDTASALRDWGIDNVGVLGRGVDTELFQPGKRDEALRRSWGLDERGVAVLYVGRLAPEKNLPLAARAMEAMRERVPGVAGVFVGDGPRGRAFQAEHPQWVHAGARVGEDLARYYASADVFVFPSATETFGNVVLEAMASGLPVVGFDYAAPRLLVRQGVNGWLAPLGDEEAFVARCLDSLETVRKERQRLSEASRAAAMEHSWDRVIRQFELELEGAIHERQRAAA